MNRAVFLDRDGTLIAEKDFLHRPDQVQIIPGTIQALRRLRHAGFLLIIVTNQSGIGRGYFTMADAEKVHAHLLQEFARRSVAIEKIYIAPEAPDQPSRGRKPSPQFLLDARKEFSLDLSQSYMIGDKWIDLECGWNAGVRQCLLVRTGYGARTEMENQNRLSPAMAVDDLPAAAACILSENQFSSA